MSAEVVLRAASGPEIGLGHVMRTRAVACALRARGARPRVVVDDARSAALLLAEGLDAALASDEPDWTEQAVEGAWLDGFRDWSSDILRLHARGTPCFLVENRGPARELAQRVVYPALHHRPDAWDAAHPERVLAGAPWIPLGPELLSVEPRDEAGARDVDLLITFGGSDPKCLTERALCALERYRGRVAVLVGPHMAERRARIAKLASKLRGARLAPQEASPSAWMARSRCALTALGTTLYELAYLGVPALILANWREDRDALAWYAEHGPHLPLGIADELDDLRLRRALRSGGVRAVSRRRACVPGLGGGALALAELLANAGARPPGGGAA